MGTYLRWLEDTADNRAVKSSNLFVPTIIYVGVSSMAERMVVAHVIRVQFPYFNPHVRMAQFG